MRKLIVAITVIALTVVANAATVNWTTAFGIGNATDSGYTAATTVYLINSATLTQSSIYEAVNGGKSIVEAIGGNSIASASLSSVGEISKQVLTIDGSGTVTYYMALFDSTLGDNGALYFSEQITKALQSVGSSNFAFSSDSSIAAIASNMDGFNTSSGGWVSVGGSSPVPEPTSAMLLMLGLCGLALKRKNA